VRDATRLRTWLRSSLVERGLPSLRRGSAAQSSSWSASAGDSDATSRWWLNERTPGPHAPASRARQDFLARRTAALR